MNNDRQPTPGLQNIGPETLTRPFMEAWQTAGRHIQQQSGGQTLWLRDNLHQPISEHLSFRLGNRLFFVFVEALIGAKAELPFEARRAARFLSSADTAGAIPCRIRLHRNGNGWAVHGSGWGLVHVETGDPVDPPALVDDQPIEMTDWELHDFAIQVVRNHLSQQSKDVTEWQSNLGIDPSIWFQDGNQRCWVVVRAARYPETEAPKPTSLPQLAAACAADGDRGFFASVVAANRDDAFDGSPPTPLYRGCGMYVRFTGLESIE